MFSKNTFFLVEVRNFERMSLLRVISTTATNVHQQTNFTHGMLEKPDVSPDVKESIYRISVVGQPGVGKSTFIAWLAGAENTLGHPSTLGSQMTRVSCICKVGSDLQQLVISLDFWESGTRGRKSIADHFQSGRKNATGLIVLFSCNDEETLSLLPQALIELQAQKDDFRQIIFLVATGWVLEESPSVNRQAMLSLENMTQGQPVIKMPLLNSSCSWDDHRTNTLQMICEHLFQDALLSMES